MSNPESTEEWIQRIVSKEAMEERQTLRAAGKLNAPIRGVRGLARLVSRRTNSSMTEGHPWPCECSSCRPWLWSDGEKIDTDREDLKHKYQPKQEQPPLKIEGKKGFKPPRKKWDSGNRGRSSN